MFGETFVGENSSCPFSEFLCKNSTDEVYEHPIGASPYLAIPALISSTLSCIGAAIIVFSYWKWKDIRTGSRAIITYLSIADFFTAFGYIIGSLNYALNYHKTSKVCVVFTYVCQFQSFITTSSSISSFFWTSSLAIYLYLTLVHNKVNQLQRFFPGFHVINWGLPIVICLPLLITGYLGYSYYAVSTWCFIGLQQKSRFDHEPVVLVMVAGKFWEIMTYILVIILYVLIKRHVIIQSRGLASNTVNANLLAMLRKSDKKLIAIPMVFVLLRCWGTIHFFYSLAVQSSIVNGCTTKAFAGGFIFFGFMQAIGDGGQGWGNFILYVMVSDRIRNKLFNCFKQRQAPSLNHLEEKSSTGTGNVSINYGTTNIDRCEKVESYEATTT